MSQGIVLQGPLGVGIGRGLGGGWAGVQSGELEEIIFNIIDCVNEFQWGLMVDNSPFIYTLDLLTRFRWCNFTILSAVSQGSTLIVAASTIPHRNIPQVPLAPLCSHTFLLTLLVPPNDKRNDTHLEKSLLAGFIAQRSIHNVSRTVFIARQ